MKSKMMRIDLKKYVDENNTELESLSNATGIEVETLKIMYDIGKFDSNKVMVNAITELMLYFKIESFSDLVPILK